MPTENQILSTVHKFKKSTVKFALTPLESSPTLPIPQIIKGKPYLSFLFFIGKRFSKNEKMKLYRPIVKLVIDANTARIINYIDYTVNDEFLESNWQKPIGEFPHPEIREMTLKNYKKQKDELIQKYDLIIKDLLSDDKDAELWKEFSRQFFNLCEPALVPYMEQLSPVFFEILRAHHKNLS